MDSYPSLHPEEHCSLPSPTATISFLRLKSESNPKTVQGARSERTQLVISPDQPVLSWRTVKVVGERSPRQLLKPPLRLLPVYEEEEERMEEEEEDANIFSEGASNCLTPT